MQLMKKETKQKKIAKIHTVFITFNLTKSKFKKKFFLFFQKYLLIKKALNFFLYNLYNNFLF